MPSTTASMKPVVTRKSEATRSAGRRPVRTSSPSPFATAQGEGKTDGGKTCNNQSADQIAMATTSTIKGSRADRDRGGFSDIGKKAKVKAIRLEGGLVR